MPTPPDWSKSLINFVNEWKRKSKNNEYIDDGYLGDNPFHKFVVTDKAKSWDQFLRWLDELHGSWCFRGQREAAWLLYTSLDRDVRRERSSPDSFILYHLNRETETRELSHRFQQYAHHYLPHVPPMAPYVAMYFAVENRAMQKRPREKESHSAVWAIDLAWLEARGREFLQSKQSLPSGVEGSTMEAADYTNHLLRETEQPVIVRINPKMSNPRLFAQQGIFLCKLHHQASFGQVLMTMMMYPETMDRPVIRKLEIGSSLRIKFLKHLRAMNIHPASLFPGLDGLGLSLKLDLELKDRDA